MGATAYRLAVVILLAAIAAGVWWPRLEWPAREAAKRVRNIGRPEELPAPGGGGAFIGSPAADAEVLRAARESAASMPGRGQPAPDPWRPAQREGAR